MTTRIALEPALALMQISDSLFPSGAFTQSYGLEQLARDGRVRTPEEVAAFITSVLHQTLATADAPAAFAANQALAKGDLDELLAVDRALYRTKAAEELRAASVSTGRRLLGEVTQYVENNNLQSYARAVNADRTLGTQPVVFGAICAALEVEAETAVAALLLGNVNGMLQAAMRLLPVSHRDVQGALHRLRPEIAAIVRDIATKEPQPLRAFHPMQEIASMRHVYANARMFAS
jgi:urease accessory protein